MKPNRPSPNDQRMAPVTTLHRMRPRYVAALCHELDPVKPHGLSPATIRRTGWQGHDTGLPPGASGTTVRAVAHQYGFSTEPMTVNLPQPIPRRAELRHHPNPTPLIRTGCHLTQKPIPRHPHPITRPAQHPTPTHQPPSQRHPPHPTKPPRWGSRGRSPLAGVWGSDPQGRYEEEPWPTRKRGRALPRIEWRCRELNPGPLAHPQGFSVRSPLCLCLTPSVTRTS